MLDGGKNRRESSNPPQRLFRVLVAKVVRVGIEGGAGESSTRHWYGILNGDIISNSTEAMEEELACLEQLIVTN